MSIKDPVRLGAKNQEILKRIDNGSLAEEDVFSALQDIIEGKFGQSGLIQEMFVSPETQLANMRSWNLERGWGFIDAYFIEAEAALANVTWPSNRLTALVLVPYLDTVQRTFDELWAVASGIQPNNWRWEELKSGKKNLRLLDGIEHKPGLRWEIIDLGANWDRQTGLRPVDVRDTTSAHAGILAAAAHFPKWVQAMDGDKVPYVWLPGYQVTVPGFEAWTYVPALYWNRDNRRVRLSASWSDSRDHTWLHLSSEECSRNLVPWGLEDLGIRSLVLRPAGAPNQFLRMRNIEEAPLLHAQKFVISSFIRLNKYGE